MPRQLVPVMQPRVWWTKKEYSAFSPLFETQAAALSYYKTEPLMMIVEQPDACTGEQV